MAHLDGEPDSVIQLGIADGKIKTVYVVRNPEKLVSLAAR